MYTRPLRATDPIAVCCTNIRTWHEYHDDTLPRMSISSGQTQQQKPAQSRFAMDRCARRDETLEQIRYNPHVAQKHTHKHTQADTNMQNDMVYILLAFSIRSQHPTRSSDTLRRAVVAVIPPTVRHKRNLQPACLAPRNIDQPGNCAAAELADNTTYG